MAWRVEAQLFGGECDGYAVKLDDLFPQITVFRNGGPPFAVSGVVDAAERPDARRLGTYELAGPIGPDTPIYVA